MRRLSIAIAVVMAFVAAIFEAEASEPFVSLEKSCATCHAVSRASVTEPGLDHIWSRQAPNLFYAGKKFQREWLVAWLQDPKPVRPAGVFYRHVAKTTSGGADTIPANALPAHPRLSAGDAGKAADALMTLNDDGGAIRAGLYKGGKVNIRFGKLAFTKLRGCSGCHQYVADQGGMSGPELATAGDRLQADYIASYIVDPQAFDPGVWMPQLGLSDQDIQRLTGYLLSLHGGAGK